jgi:glyoxylase-like metal-dependent hydrolase (beta-lactamase superfamily II)
MLDAGASAAHARRFLDALASQGLPAPHFVALTHWHWDHVFGAAELGVPIIAHVDTAERFAVMAGYGRSDEALDQRVAMGEEIAICADHIKTEYFIRAFIAGRKLG